MQGQELNGLLRQTDSRPVSQSPGNVSATGQADQKDGGVEDQTEGKIGPPTILDNSLIEDQG